MALAFLARPVHASENRTMQLLRRHAPRVALESLCNEIAGGIERPALVVDVSPDGLRIARPFDGGRTPREVQLELELPGVDDILWARGRTRFDQVRQVRGELWRVTGIVVAAAAAHDLALLRDYVMAQLAA